MSAKWKSSNTRTTGPVAAIRSKKVRQAPNSSSEPHSGVEPEERQQGGLDPAPLGLVGDVAARQASRDLGPGRRLVVGLQQPAPAADHLAERPEGDPLAVGRGPAAVPVDGFDEPVDVLEELPGQAALADAGRTR